MRAAIVLTAVYRHRDDELVRLSPRQRSTVCNAPVTALRATSLTVAPWSRPASLITVRSVRATANARPVPIGRFNEVPRCSLREISRQPGSAVHEVCKHSQATDPIGHDMVTEQDQRGCAVCEASHQGR